MKSIIINGILQPDPKPSNWAEYHTYDIYSSQGTHMDRVKAESPIHAIWLQDSHLRESDRWTYERTYDDTKADLIVVDSQGAKFGYITIRVE